MTAKENIVLDLVCDWLGESRFNRTADEYVKMAARIPKLAAVHACVNSRLDVLRQRRCEPFLICDFKVGDVYVHYQRFPKKISETTVRKALINSGFWALMHPN